MIYTNKHVFFEYVADNLYRYLPDMYSPPVQQAYIDFIANGGNWDDWFDQPLLNALNAEYIRKNPNATDLDWQHDDYFWGIYYGHYKEADATLDYWYFLAATVLWELRIIKQAMVTVDEVVQELQNFGLTEEKLKNTPFGFAFLTVFKDDYKTLLEAFANSIIEMYAESEDLTI